MSSRELGGALAAFDLATAELHVLWDTKPFQLTMLRELVTTTTNLVEELAHPEYEHARAVRLARELFDAGLKLVKIIDVELANTADTTPLRRSRGAALTMMETIAGYLSPLAGLRAA